jgi:hypothetical protein
MLAMVIPTKATHLYEAAVRVAREGLGAHYHASVLHSVWERATPEQWARLAVLAGERPPDAIIRGAVLDLMRGHHSGARLQKAHVR